MFDLIDSHCHLHYDFKDQTIQQIIENARLSGIKRMITVAVDVPSFAQVQKLSHDHPEIYHSVGIHPHEAHHWNESTHLAITKASHNPKCVAIGELGLDYFYKYSTPEQQKEVLRKQLELAVSLQKPVIVHGRDAGDDLLFELTRFAKNWNSSKPLGVIHCFTESLEFGQKCIDLGFYISFSGILTFKTAENLRDCARAFDLKRLLVETDAPYLAPIPFRGKTCVPSMVKSTAQKLAEIKNISFEELARITTQNTQDLFGDLCLT